MPAPPQTVPMAAAPVAAPMTSSARHQVRVRFYRRMKVQRVYEMVVELRPDKKTPSSGAGAGAAVVARPLVPGALVQPAEQELGTKASNNTIRFAVTPLGRGRLKGARLQLLHQGRVLEEIATPMTATSQRTTWVLFFLTLLSLAWLLDFFHLPDKTTATYDGPLKADLKLRLPDYDDHLPGAVRDYLARDVVAQKAQHTYDDLYAAKQLPFQATAVLFLLTLLSWWFHRTKRSSRKGKAMLLPSGAATVPGDHPLAFGNPGR